MLNVESLAEEIVRDPGDRRLTSRLVKYWKVLRAARPLLSRHEFRLTMVPELMNFGFALDLNAKPPEFRCIGTALRDETGCDFRNRPITEIPPGTVIGWITENLDAVVNARRPVDWDFSFSDPHGRQVKVRSTLLPFSDDGARVDYIFGAITFKKSAGLSELT